MAKDTKFQPGESGNPEGRPKGSKNWSTILLAALKDDVPELIEKTKEKALEGDMTAMRLLLERALPVRKAVAPQFELPELGRAKTLTEKAEAILLGVSNGLIPPDIASQLIASIGSVAKIIEIDELEKRIEALEQVHE